MADEDDTKAKAQVEKCKTEVESLIARSQYDTAVIQASSNPPKTKSEKIKDMQVSVFCRAVEATPDTKIKDIVEGMDSTQRSNTMKYVYRAMAISENPQSLLKWHGELFSKDGAGIVMRALVDRSV